MRKHKKPAATFLQLRCFCVRADKLYILRLQQKTRSSQIFYGVLLHSALVNMLTLDSAVYCYHSSEVRIMVEESSSQG